MKKPETFTEAMRELCVAFDAFWREVAAALCLPELLNWLARRLP